MLQLESRRAGNETAILKKFECPKFPPVDLERLRRRMSKGPVFSRKAVPAGGLAHEHLFIIAQPHSGSTALLGLVGSSPEVSTLCSSYAWACEGRLLLQKAGLFPDRDKGWNQMLRRDMPADWNEAVGVYSKVWNTSKAVLVDKEPTSVGKAAKIADDLRRAGKKAVFLVLTRSPCYTHPSNLMTMVNAVREAASEQIIHVRYEDLTSDPYGTAQRIVDAYPRLRSLDPAATVLPSWFGNRSAPIVSYLLQAQKESVRTSRAPMRTSEVLKYAQEFGYA